MAEFRITSTTFLDAKGLEGLDWTPIRMPELTKEEAATRLAVAQAADEEGFDAVEFWTTLMGAMAEGEE